MLHLHVRDKDLGHSLDPALYKEAINSIRLAVGPEMIIQITTEAVGRYQPEEQMACVRKTKPEAVSLAIRELLSDPQYESIAAEFFTWLHRERIAPQYILYDDEDITLFHQLCKRGLIPDERIPVLLVLGRYHENQQSDPELLTPLQNALRPDWLWSVCAFGKNESLCMQAAIESGGHCRVGFENNLYGVDGSIVDSNTDLVANTAACIKQAGHEIAHPAIARELFHIYHR